MKFGVILADPPWLNKAATKDQEAFSAEHYNAPTFRELCELPVSLVAAENAYLFLWVDAQHHHVASQVAEHWGFWDFATKLTWLKTQPGTGMRTPGIGRYTMTASEDCWVFKRGKPPLVETPWQNPIEAPRSQHSRKPDKLYEYIETVHSKKRRIFEWPSPRLEMFARTHYQGNKTWGPREGWVQLGDEFDGPMGLGENIKDGLLRVMYDKT